MVKLSWLKLDFCHLAIALIFITMGSSGFAGQLIKLKNGTFDPQQLMFPTPSLLKQNAKFAPSANRQIYIVQFDSLVQDVWKQELSQYGVEFYAYVPEDAFIARVASADAWWALNHYPHVRSVIAYDQRLKVQSDLQNLAGSDQNVPVTVRLVNPEWSQAFVQNVKALGVTPSQMQPISQRLFRMVISQAQLAQVASIEGVEWMEPAQQFVTMDFHPFGSGSVQPEPTPVPPQNFSELTGYESGTKIMGFDGAWARGLHGEGQVVGIDDTGLDRGSTTNILADFQGQILKGMALGLFSTSWEDSQGHGTHTSGSIVSTGRNSGGIIKGGAFGAKLAFGGFWSPVLRNLTLMPDGYKLFGQFRQSDNVHIHSNSWGAATNFGAYDNFAALIDEVSWQYPDLLILFAAGNSGVDANHDGHIDPGSVSSPGTAKDCLTVGASENLVFRGGIQNRLIELRGGQQNWGVGPMATSRLSENANGMAAFSSTGPTKDGRIKPEISAPGTNILSTRSQDRGASALWGAFGQYYAWAGGTSMATPLTAGAATLVRQYLKNMGFQDPSAALIKASLIDTAIDMYPGQYGMGQYQEFAIKRPNNHEGFGRVNVDLATQLKPEAVKDEVVGLATGEKMAFDLAGVQPGQVVRATMVYTDAPAAANAAYALVNDLDLAVIDAAGVVHYPNHLNGPDNKNNTEMVEFTAGNSGTYRVVVSARSVPRGRDGTGRQPFALVFNHFSN